MTDQPKPTKAEILAAVDEYAESVSKQAHRTGSVWDMTDARGRLIALIERCCKDQQ